MWRSCCLVAIMRCGGGYAALWRSFCPVASTGFRLLSLFLRPFLRKPCVSLHTLPSTPSPLASLKSPVPPHTCLQLEFAAARADTAPRRCSRLLSANVDAAKVRQTLHARTQSPRYEYGQPHSDAVCHGRTSPAFELGKQAKVRFTSMQI